MTKKRRNPTAVETSRALRDVLLEASSSELQDAIDYAGLDAEDLASAGRRAVQAGIQHSLESPRLSDMDLASFKDLKRGLGAVLQLLRRREGITEEELAKRARIDADEVRRIEFDPDFEPRPRTIYQLEEFFRLPAKTLAVLSGAIRARSEKALREEVVRFAAHSSAVAKLGREEKKLLNGFVKFLAEQVD